MCFTRMKRRKMKRARRVYPKPAPPSFTTDEVIQCQGCYNHYTLQDIKISCYGCNKFFHCHVAGTCYGSACKSTLRNGKVHRKSWCTNCVPIIPENKPKTSRDEKCLCNGCSVGL